MKPDATFDPATSDSNEVAEDVSVTCIGTEEEPSHSVMRCEHNDLTAAILRLEETAQTGFTEMREAFERKLAFDNFKEEQVSRLHAELQSYKNDLVGQLKAPLINGLVRLHDDLGKTVDSLARRTREDQTPERFFRALAGFADDIELLLGQHGVEAFETQNDTFDPRVQTALRTEPTSKAAQVGTLASRLRPGFEQGEKVWQKERVSVFVAAPEPPDEEDPQGNEPPTGEEAT